MKDFKINDKVFAKVKGYPPWPAKILGFNGSKPMGRKSYDVEFYGTKETAVVKEENICYYLKNKSKYNKPIKRKVFQDAIDEIETAITKDGGDGDNSDNDTEMSDDISRFTPTDMTFGRESVLSRRRSSLKRKLSTADKETINDDDIPKKEVTEEKKKKESRVPEPKFIIEKYDFVSEQDLRNNIAYADYLSKHESIYKNKPVEHRENNDFIQVLPVKLETGKICGIKLQPHKQFEYELQQAIYEKENATTALELYEKILNDTADLNQSSIIPDVGLTWSEITQIWQDKSKESERNKHERISRELDLNLFLCEIKNCLTLQNARPKEALVCLERILDVHVDILTLKKHSDVVMTMRRLRRYVGNVDEWRMNAEAAKEFVQLAEKIQKKAAEIYSKYMKVMNLSEDGWSKFLEIISEFENQCNGLTNEQIQILSAEPMSRRGILERIKMNSEDKPIL